MNDDTDDTDESDDDQITTENITNIITIQL